MYTVPTYLYVIVAILLVPVFSVPALARRLNPLRTGLVLLACAGLIPPMLFLVK